jgi:hypothetical protein
MGRTCAERAEDSGRVISQHFNRHRPAGIGCSAGAPVVEGSKPIAVGQPVQLELPGLDRIAQASDQQHIRSLTHLLGPDSQIPDLYVHSHGLAFRSALSNQIKYPAPHLNDVQFLPPACEAQQQALTGATIH